MAKELTNNQVLLGECIRREYDDSTGYSGVNAFFEHFATAQVLKNYNLSDEEIDDGNSGGANDGGCDNLYVFLNGDVLAPDQINDLSVTRGSLLEFCIVQAKNTFGFEEDALMKWKTTSNNLLSFARSSESFSTRYNETIIERFTLFRDAVTKLIRNKIKIVFRYYYVTLALEAHPNVQAQADELCEIVKKNYPAANVVVKFIGADDLMSFYHTDGEVRLNLELVNQPISQGARDYVALVELGTYFKFITDENHMLRKSFFESNVRDYQGHNSVNKSIAKTLASNTGEDFWWLNNGVTILAADVVLITQKSLQLVNPEIVNGLQTSREIFQYFEANSQKLCEDHRTVLVRIIVPESEESRDSIIFATNNQTNIPKSSLRVTDAVHLQIEMYFKSRGLYYDRRKNYYKNQNKRAQDIIGVSFLAQCLISLVLQKPDYARARPSTLLTDEETYHKLYEENQNLEAYYNAARIGRRVRNFLRACTTMTTAERSDILFYMVYAVVAKHLMRREISFEDVQRFNVDFLSDEKLEAVRIPIYAKYKELGGNGRVAKSSTFINDINGLIGI